MAAGKADSVPGTRSWLQVLKGPVIAYVLSLVVFGALMGDRLKTHSRDNHYVYFADGMLDGRLTLEGRPPHANDWAKHDGKWFVCFPPLPAVLMMPGVALQGLEFNDRLFTLFFAAAGPALLLALLQLLAARGRLGRKPWELGLLTALYGVGTVYFFCAVQGSVWFTAHMVGAVMLLAFLIASVDARHPALAGLFIGLAFACRPPMILALPFFAYEALRQGADDAAPGFSSWLASGLRGLGARRIARTVALFAIPLAVVVGLLMAMNAGRLGDPIDFGHKYLVVKQTARIEKWGLFHTHYLAHNLGVALTSLPWLSADPPYVKVSLHGLALWFTTPAFLWILWPKAASRQYLWIAATALLVAAPSLLYQNSGWVQFGYRFSCDFAPLLLLLLALGGRRFGKLFAAAVVFGIAVNLFGAITFDRVWKHYAGGKLRDEIYQPD
jgi:hypothetical protein